MVLLRVFDVISMHATRIGKGRITCALRTLVSISGLVVEYIVAIDMTRARFPADASLSTLVPEDAQCQNQSGTEMMT